MKLTPFASLSIALLSLGCASMHDTERATNASRAIRAEGDAVHERLARLPALGLSWSTPLAALTPADVVTLCHFEQRAVSPRAVHASCENGRTVTVGAGGGFCDGDAFEDARVVGAACDLDVGELVACELALRDDPCASGASAAPECAAFDACQARLLPATRIAELH